MAERVMLVCDTCGRPSEETILYKYSGGNRQRDYCSTHLQELVAGSRTPKRGRKPGSSNAKRQTSKPSARKKTTRKKTTRKRTTGRKKA